MLTTPERLRAEIDVLKEDIAYMSLRDKAIANALRGLRRTYMKRLARLKEKSNENQ